MAGPGTVVVSVDAELGWGFHDLGELPVERLRSARAGWMTLLELFDVHRLPATWAVVGHLLLEHCQDHHRGHPAGERCCTTDTPELGADDIWFGTDLVEAVLDAAVDHEVASHGFTHLHFQHERMTPAIAASELAASRDAAARLGIDPTTFIYPVNRPGYRDQLASHGFTCYRGVGSTPGRRRNLGKLGAVIGRGKPPIVQPRVDEYGLVSVPGSLYLFGFDGLARRVVEPAAGDPIVGYVRRGLDDLANREGLLHLWLHPHNIRSDRDVRRLRAVMEAISQRRDDGGLRVATMGAVADRTVAGRPRPPSPAASPAGGRERS